MGRSIDALRDVMVQRFDSQTREINYRFEENAKAAEERYKDQGRRIGNVEASRDKLQETVDELEKMLVAHAQKCGGNGLRPKAIYAGGGVAVFEILHRIAEAIIK